MSEFEELQIRRRIREAQSAGNAQAELEARRSLRDFLARTPAAQPPQVPAEPAVTPQDLGIPMSPESIQPTQAPNAELQAQMQRERIVPGSAPAGIRAPGSVCQADYAALYPVPFQQNPNRSV